ncbi:MAG: serine hydrolase domain-containing protein [Acidimicrobiales bacterium]
MMEIKGTFDKSFSGVVTAFRRNFEDLGEVGASVAIMREGRLVVDIWAGHSDTGLSQPWKRDTITNVFSITKTMATLSALVLADRGDLDVFKPVADYWPEFAANGKEKIEVRHLMSHTSGLSGWDKKITIREICDWRESTAILAEQKPWWQPGTSSGYHALTQGHLVGEVIRRITGESIGEFFAKEIAEPLGADFHIGLGERDFYRVSDVIYPREDIRDQMMERAKSIVKLGVTDEVAVKTLQNPRNNEDNVNSEWWRKAEIPAANGHGNARSVATIQGLITNGGEINGVRLLKTETIDLIFQEQSNGLDLVFLMPLRFGIGYALPNEEFSFLPQDRRVCFWGGNGGSIFVNDVDENVTISYIMNKMIATPTVGDARGIGIIEATYKALKSINSAPC